MILARSSSARQLVPGGGQQLQIVAQIFQALREVAAGGCLLSGRGLFCLRRRADRRLLLQPLLDGGIAQQVQQQLDLVRWRFARRLRLFLRQDGRG